MSAATLTTILIIAAMAAFFTAVADDSKSVGKTSPVTESRPVSGYRNVNPELFDKLRQSKTNLVIDVRTKEEYQNGHVPGAINIDFTSDDFAEAIAKLDKSKTYLVHCARGGRSARACRKMEQMGFKSLVNLEGGLTAWESAGKPVEKPTK